MNKGIFEFKINEKQRGFKFGTYAFAVACEREKCTLDELLRRVGIGGEVARVNIMSLLNIFYGAAVHYAEDKNTEVDFKPSNVSDWLDDLGLEQVNKIIAEGLNQYVPKNSKSLAETGEMVTQ